MSENKNILDKQEFKSNPFVVPEDYFESNKLKLLEKLSSNHSVAFQIPEDYFETNALKLKEKILSDNYKNVFDIPQDYFEQSKQNIIKKVNINVHPKRKIIRWAVYFSAAAALLMAVWGTWLYLQVSENSPPPFKPCQTIACLTKKDILSKEHILDDELLEESISDEAIEKYLETSPPSLKDTNTNTLHESF